MRYKETMYLTKCGWNARYLEDCINVRFRFDPVPSTGSRWHFGCFYKRPKTTQERKWSFAYPEYVRGRRRKLPNAWDDEPRAKKGNSWKGFSKKRKQWQE